MSDWSGIKRGRIGDRETLNYHQYATTISRCLYRCIYFLIKSKYNFNKTRRRCLLAWIPVKLNVESKNTSLEKITFLNIVQTFVSG